MFCKFCGQQIDDVSVFCSKCGKKVSDETSKNNIALKEKEYDVASTILYKEQNTISIQTSPEEERAGMLIYLKDVRNLAFIVNKLQDCVNQKIANAASVRAHAFDKTYMTSDEDHNGYHIDDFFSNENTRDRNVRYKTSNHDSRRSTHLNFRYDGKNYYFCVTPFTYYYSSMLWLGGKNLKRLKEPPAYNYIFNTSNSEDCFWIYDAYYRSAAHDYLVAARSFQKSFLECYEDFLNIAPDEYKKEMECAKRLDAEAAEAQAELDKATALLEQEYTLNIIPNKLRNLGALYYICDYFETSVESLSSIFFHLDLDEIKSQLSNIIANQQEIIINQAIQISQNEAMLKQNEAMLKKLSSIEQSSIQTSNLMAQNAQWTKIAANNAEACAWIGAAHYINQNI